MNVTKELPIAKPNAFFSLFMLHEQSVSLDTGNPNSCNSSQVS